MKCKHYLLPWKPGFNCAYSLVHNIKSWPYSVFLFLTCLCLLFFLCSAGFTKGRVCQSPCAPPQQGLKIHSLHLPCFTPPTHMSFSMSAETHTHFLSQAHCTDDTSSPHDTSSSRRKTSKSAFSCQWHPEFAKSSSCRSSCCCSPISTQASRNELIHYITITVIFSLIVDHFYLTLPFIFVLSVLIIPQLFGNKKTAVFLFFSKAWFPEHNKSNTPSSGWNIGKRIQAC